MQLGLKPRWMCVLLLTAVSFCLDGAAAQVRPDKGGVAHADAGTSVRIDHLGRSNPGTPADHLNPEAGSGYHEKQEVRARNFMLSTANPLATKAGYQILEQGGSAIDAAIAAQMVLNLVEPQSSGIGGGAFILYYDKAQNTLTSYDGRETAPAGASPDRFMRNGDSMPFWATVNSGLSVGVPGLLAALEMAHQQQGILPWADLFQPAIQLAERGFKVSPRLHHLLTQGYGLGDQKAAAEFFLDSQGEPWPVGHVLKNPNFAQTLREIAASGAHAFYTGSIARDIVAAVRNHSVPGDLSLSDLADYQAKQREPVCGDYHAYRVCGMGPPSAGGIGVIQMLGILQHFPMKDLAPTSAQAIHYFSEAGRLAYADRDYYVADPAFIDFPAQALIAPSYLEARARQIRPERTMGRAEPGNPAPEYPVFGRDNALEIPSTTHISAVDAHGNVVSMTSSIESAFGSKILVRGFLLNNQLTDFSHTSVDEDDNLIANRVQPGKRPRSTMAPTVVFKDGEPFLAVGSPGGSAIINYVAKTLMGVLAWGLDIQEAISLPNFGSRNRQTELEQGRGLERAADALRSMGHSIRFSEYPSGIQGVVIKDGWLRGGADPRREGSAQGG